MLNQKIIDSGIGERILQNLKKYFPNSNPSMENLQFSVEQDTDESTGDILTHVVVEFPNGRTRPTTVAFQVEHGKTFGADGDAPLTDEQHEVIKEILEAQAQA